MILSEHMNSKFLTFFFFFSVFMFQAQTEVVPAYQDSVWTEKEDYYQNLLPADSLLRADLETSNTIYPKKFKPKFREQYKGDDFDYSTTKPRESLFEKITRGIQKIIESIFGKMDPMKAGQITTTILKLIAILLAAVILYFLIRYLVSKEGNFFFGKRNKKLDIRSGDLHENIHEINFQESILQYERQKDYRSAIRYHFLFLLKKLSDKKAIDWNPEKTNRDYLREIKDQHLKLNYEKLAFIFDNVWYGEYEIEEGNYQQFAEEFKQSGV